MTNEPRSMCALTHLTGVLSEHKRRYHELHITPTCISFRVRDEFSFGFDSDNSVVDIVSDEMLSHISTKLSGSVGRFIAALVTYPERDAK